MDPSVKIDWGNGCFWHVQREMIKAEQALLGRATFPFFKGKIYHQFHNDMSEDYGRKYNNLRKPYAEACTMQETNRPENFM